MTDKPLRPATRDEVSQALGYALRYGRSGKSHRLATEMTARIAADVLAEYLEMAGFIVLKKPAAAAPVVHYEHKSIPLKD